MKGPQRRSINLKNLSILNILLPITRIILVNRNLGTDLQKVRNPADMIRVPVSD